MFVYRCVLVVGVSASTGQHFVTLELTSRDPVARCSNLAPPPLWRVLVAAISVGHAAQVLKLAVVMPGSILDIIDMYSPGPCPATSAPRPSRRRLCARRPSARCRGEAPRTRRTWKAPAARPTFDTLGALRTLKSDRRAIRAGERLREAPSGFTSRITLSCIGASTWIAVGDPPLHDTLRAFVFAENRWSPSCTSRVPGRLRE